MAKGNIDIKALLGKLSFLRNNLSLFIPVIIVIIGLALFLPTRLISARLRKQIEDESGRASSRVERLLKDPVTKEAADKAQESIAVIAQDANQISQLVANSCKRELLSYRIFPEPNETSRYIFEVFGKTYVKRVDDLLSGIGAGDCPTDAEIDRALQSAATRMSFGGRTQPSSTSFRSGRFRRSIWGMSEIDRKIVDEICVERASGLAVYALPKDVAGYEFWLDYKYDTTAEQALKDCWYWQLGYWIVEDVITSTRKVNTGRQSVIDAPVKRIMGINFDLSAKGIMRTRRAYGARKKDTPAPAYVTDHKDALVLPCTGRFSKEETGIDVVQFNVIVIVRADAVLPFIKELCSQKEHRFRGFFGNEPEQTFMHNQISILESSATAIETDSTKHDLYRYGNGAALELNLICEYVLDRAAYDPIKPQAVKDEMTGDDTNKR